MKIPGEESWWGGKAKPWSVEIPSRGLDPFLNEFKNFINIYFLQVSFIRENGFEKNDA